MSEERFVLAEALHSPRKISNRIKIPLFTSDSLLPVKDLVM